MAKNPKHEALMKRVRTSVGIVEAMAAHEPYTEHLGIMYCVLCGQNVFEDKDELPQHAKECPYRRAHEFLY